MDSSGLTLVWFRVIDGDEFIRNLWEVHLRVKAEGYTQVYMRATHNVTQTYGHVIHHP
jgi:glutathione synthase